MASFPLCLHSLWLILSPSLTRTTDQRRPNIIFMFGDDLGFNELGYSNCTDTATPNLDRLATSDGLILSTNYVSKICSPSRSALISGRYPSTLGLQNLVFNVQYPVSLTRQVSILSEEFRANGYSTHCIGKWHLGFTAWEYTPRYRGFDTFSGFYGGLQYYYNHSEAMGPDMYYDLRIGEDKDLESITDEIYGPFLERDQTLNLLSDLKQAEDPFFVYIGWQASHLPNEAPSEYTDRYLTAKNKDRMHCQAQTTTLDDSIGAVVDYLKSNGMWNDTLIVFSSDNGGNYDRADNFPLRGFKNSSFEGGIRVPAFVTGGYLAEDRRGKILDDVMVSVVDWYPTLLSAANLEVGYYRSTKLYGSNEIDTRFDESGVGEVPLDGLDIWRAIQFGEVDEAISVDSRELLLDLNTGGECDFVSCGAIRSGKWKFIRGRNMGVNASVTDGNQWQSDFATCSEDVWGCSSSEVAVDALNCISNEDGCLFDLDADPCEKQNVGSLYPKIRDDLIDRLNFYESKASSPLIRKNNVVDNQLFLPPFLGETFWTPYMDYNAVQFENELIPFWSKRYPKEETLNGEMDGEWTMMMRGYSMENVVFGVIAVLLLNVMCCVRWCCLEKSKAITHGELKPLMVEI